MSNSSVITSCLQILCFLHALNKIIYSIDTKEFKYLYSGCCFSNILIPHCNVWLLWHFLLYILYSFYLLIFPTIFYSHHRCQIKEPGKYSSRTQTTLLGGIKEHLRLSVWYALVNKCHLLQNWNEGGQNMRVSNFGTFVSLSQNKSFLLYKWSMQLTEEDWVSNMPSCKATCFCFFPSFLFFACLINIPQTETINYC